MIRVHRLDVHGHAVDGGDDLEEGCALVIMNNVNLLSDHNLVARTHSLQPIPL